VTARTSASQFQGQAADVREIGGKLGVRLVLEGSVRKSGDRFRVAAQLVNTQDGLHLWSETYDRPVNDIFAVQDEIARAITAALQVTLATGRLGAPSNRYTGNVQLYELYLKGRYSLNTVTPSSADTAQSYFAQVIEKDPNFAPAWVGMAEVYLMRAGQAFSSSQEMMRKAREAVERALRIDDTLPEAHSIRGSLLSNFEWDWAGAAREFDRAIQLDPNLSRAYLGRSNLHGIHGRFAEMEESLRHAQLLDPLSSSVSQKFTQLYYYSRRTDRMIDYCRDASVGWMTLCLGNAYADSGRLAEGIKLLEKFYQGRDPGAGFGMLIVRYAQGGRRADALRLLEEVKTLSRQRYVSSFSMAQAYVGLGDKDQAFAWLDKGFEEREMKMNTLRVEPSFDPIRSDTRFALMLKKLRL
jgi:tetratricopeptide (TPR) repeat protein